MGSLAQILRQADTLKVTLSESGKRISDLWSSRQRLEDLYMRLLLSDLEYALDKKVEQDLWNHAFKNQINLLQIQAKDKQNLKRGENQASLNLFLETASGFYLQLLQLICSTFKLDLPFRSRSASFGVMNEKCPVKKIASSPKKSSCLYICQHCLVHLGDVARYRQQVEQAQTFYRHAAQIVPQNGQPYNQLAILEAARGNKLSTVFYYIRSLAVRHPFPVAATNLEKFYIKLSKEMGEVSGKLSVSEVVSTFLQFTALVHLCSDLNKALGLRERLLGSLPSHLTSQSFTTNTLLEMVTITVFSLSNAQKSCRETDGEEMHFTTEEKQAMDLIQGFSISLLDMLVQATPKQEQKAKEFFTLPPIKILLDWLKGNTHVMQDQQIAIPSLWIGLAKLLNNIQDPTSLENYDEIPLPEDSELRCFQPLEQAFSTYSFSRVPVGGLPPDIQRRLRCERLVNHGKWLAQHVARHNIFSCVLLKSGRLQFSSPLQSTITTVQGIEKKPGRQNVAIQAIIQKRKKPESMEIKLTKQGPMEEDIMKTHQMSRQSSSKYLLGIPTSEPQFMKHAGKMATPTQVQHQRYPSPTQMANKQISIQKAFPTQGGMDGKQVSPYHDPAYLQDVQKEMPMQMGNTPHHFQQPDMNKLQASLNGSERQTLAYSPLPQHHMQQQQQQQGPVHPPTPYQKMAMNQIPPQMMQQLANQLAAGEKMETALSHMNKPMTYSQSRQNQEMMQHKAAEPNSPRMANYPAAMFGNPGFSPLRPMMGYGPMYGQVQPTSDPAKSAGGQRSLGGLSPQTIQPPSQAVIDSRQNLVFQGHAEGTPKPNFSPEKRSSEGGGGGAVSQPRIYSLFSSSPWEVSPMSGGEPAGATSNQSTPMSVKPPARPDMSRDERTMSLFSENQALKSGPSMLHHMGQYGQGGMPLMWSTAGPSPLERLLEQQKQQRNTDQ